MTPRGDVEVLDIRAGDDEISKVLATRHTRLPVRDGKPDEIVGVLAVKDALARLSSGGEVDLRALVQEAPVVMDSTDALQLVEQLRQSTAHMALVFDEYGHFEGIVTAMDVLETITGAFTDEGEEEPALAVRAD